MSHTQTDLLSVRKQRILLDIADLAPLEEVADRLARAAMMLTDADYSALGIYGQNGHLEHFVTAGVSDELRGRIGDPPSGIGLLGEFARSAVTLNLANMNEHPSAVGLPSEHPPIGPFLGVPVMNDEQVLGAFYVSRRPGGPPFDEAAERQLKDLAPYAAIAMSNANTLERERARADRADILAAAANRIQNATSDDEVCGALLEALQEMAPGAAVLVQLDDTRPCDSTGLDEGHLFDRLTAIPRRGGKARRISQGDRLICLADGRGDLPVRIAVALDGIQADGIDEAIAQLCELGSAGITAGLRREAEASLERYAIRDAIARDLHDDLIQSIYAIGLDLGEATDDPVALQETLARAMHGLNEVIRDLRSYIAELSRGPEMLNEAARLKLRIEVLLDSAAPPPDWTSTIELGDDALAPKIERQLYLIVREAVSNVHRHAEAKRATLSLTHDEDTLYLEVTDDGRGYERQEVPANAVGLRSIEERVADLGGSVVMDSGESGTSIRATFPIGAQHD